MTIEKLVDRYMDAWNQKDAAALLELMHSEAAYYDAFWRETCIGDDLLQYLVDSFEEEPYWYQIIGEVSFLESGAAFRYSAHRLRGATGYDAIFEGAEILTVRDGKILTVSDFYCNPLLLEEITELEVRRHGELRYAQAGLSASRSARIGKQLIELWGEDSANPDSRLSVLELAEKLDCSVDHLLLVVDACLGSGDIDSESRYFAAFAEDLQSQSLLQIPPVRANN